ncbi:hypothetical protein [Bacillus sp. FJAT-47783]|uniref:hypothetical protein n=1 Tax=Bacillus sp. FJAT-47783 TaxID=2922712 RepID=UPI001FAE0202|nr:hypothetical protein [Bacillus sp. FJAT-47783]
MKYMCPVCGFKGLFEPAYDKDGYGSFEICVCYGFEFGYDDYVEMEDGDLMPVKETHRIYRDKWIKDGAVIFQPKRYPEKFQTNNKVYRDYLKEQLKNISFPL